MTLRTEPFTIPRILFARLSAELYVRHFWYLLLPWPLLAVAMIVMSRDPRIMAMAIIVGLWPTTIPIRAFFSTSKAARLLQRPVWVSLEDEYVLFHPEEGVGMRIALDRITGVVEMHGFLAIMIGHVKFAFVPAGAFGSAKDVEKFRKRLILRI